MHVDVPVDMTHAVTVDPGLIARYGERGPRYTSYPTAVSFHEGFDEVAYRLYAGQSNDDLIPRPLSIYVHMPFCRSLCYYCACTKKITQHARHGVEYLACLDREIELQAALFDRDREVIQLHFGGGTPTFFEDHQLAGTLERLRNDFSLSDATDREFSIEIDPRTVDAGRLERLGRMGFNRLSMGVQDFDPDVQAAVNRVQDQSETLALIPAARQAGFNSVSVDLIYGLPRQTPASFERTLATLLDARPDRLAVYNYAHLPNTFRAQRLIREDELPTPKERLEILQRTIGRLAAAGYVYIGMDHFALPDDELARARESGGLHRNFQGYTTCRECDLVGLGVSAIGRINGCYSQNHKDIRRWQAAIEAGHLPVWRGVSLGFEDLVRQSVIEAIMCYGRLRFRDIEERFDLEFSEHFAPELERMKALRADGLVELDDDGLAVTPAGLLLLRAVAMVFDEYLPEHLQNGHSGFSRVV